MTQQPVMKPLVSAENNNVRVVKAGGTLSRSIRRWRFTPRKTLLRRVPALSWVRRYDGQKLVGDAVAGISVGLMTVPQALAYSIVAGLPPNYGLYSAFMGSFVYLFFGTTAHLTIGPTAVMALLTRHYTSQGGPDYAVLLAFVSGALELLAAIVNLGFLVNFISTPVISGFCSAAAVTIISSQVKALLGLKLNTHGVLDVWHQVARHLPETRWQDAVMGLLCMGVLIFLKNLGDILKCSCCKHSGAGDRSDPADPPRNSCLDKCRQRTLFVLSVGRNAIVVVLATLVAFCTADEHMFTLTGYVDPGLPDLALPPFNPVVGNTTVSFLEVMQDVGVGVIILPFIAILDNIAIIQAVYPGRSIDRSQEIAVLGMVNIFGSLFRSMPTTGSLSRTAINKSSGGVTPASGILSGVMVLLALAFLTPAFRWIPRSSLAAVIMCAVVHMIDVRLFVTLWRSCRTDLLVLCVTFSSCLVWGVEWGVLTGAALHLALLLFSTARPVVTVTCAKTLGGQEYVLAIPRQGVQYPSITHLRTRVERAGRKKGRGILPVLLDCSGLQAIDYTAAKGFINLSKDFHERQQTLVYVNMPSHIERTLHAATDTNDLAVNLAQYSGPLDEESLTVEDFDLLTFPSGQSVFPPEYQLVSVTSADPVSDGVNTSSHPPDGHLYGSELPVSSVYSNTNMENNKDVLPR